MWADWSLAGCLLWVVMGNCKSPAESTQVQLSTGSIHSLHAATGRRKMLPGLPVLHDAESPQLFPPTTAHRSSTVPTSPLCGREQCMAEEGLQSSMWGSLTWRRACGHGMVCLA